MNLGGAATDKDIEFAIGTTDGDALCQTAAGNAGATDGDGIGAIVFANGVVAGGGCIGRIAVNIDGDIA